MKQPHPENVSTTTMLSVSACTSLMSCPQSPQGHRPSWDRKEFPRADRCGRLAKRLVTASAAAWRWCRGPSFAHVPRRPTMTLGRRPEAAGPDAARFHHFCSDPPVRHGERRAEKTEQGPGRRPLKHWPAARHRRPMNR